jgi:hypothetical protein
VVVFFLDLSLTGEFFNFIPLDMDFTGPININSAGENIQPTD